MKLKDHEDPMKVIGLLVREVVAWRDLRTWESGPGNEFNEYQRLEHELELAQKDVNDLVLKVTK